MTGGDASAAAMSLIKVLLFIRRSSRIISVEAFSFRRMTSGLQVIRHFTECVSAGRRKNCTPTTVLKLFSGLFRFRCLNIGLDVNIVVNDDLPLPATPCHHLQQTCAEAAFRVEAKTGRRAVLET